mmetsp:Transcript_11046/g.23672  ORF Transcript_11046/g.23672 Transcript_11046/m.23672 type:complete len:393 (-) Transcript_11046:423-1601(-)
MHIWACMILSGTLLHLTLSFVLVPQCPMLLMKSRAISSRTIISDRNLWLTNLGTFRMATPQTSLWYTIKYEDAPPNYGKPPIAVHVPDSMRTTTSFLDLLRTKNPNSIGICDHADLKVYRTVTDFAAKADALDWKDDISTFGIDKSDPLCVVLPNLPVTKSASSPEVSGKVSNARKLRWEKINNVLDSLSKSKIGVSGVASTPFSAISWNDVGQVFEPYMRLLSLPDEIIPARDLDVLYNCVISVVKCFGFPSVGNEAKRLYFIAPILVCVCLLLKDVLIEVEENFRGSRIKTNGKFEFVLCRGGKRICITEAKTGELMQGRAQALLGCEALSDIQGLSTVYCVITDFIKWDFLCSKDDVIEVYQTSLDFEMGVPTRESLGKIAGKLYSLLS